MSHDILHNERVKSLLEYIGGLRARYTSAVLELEIKEETITRLDARIAELNKQLIDKIVEVGTLERTLKSVTGQ